MTTASTTDRPARTSSASRLRVENGIARHAQSFIALRRDLHQHPELSFQEHRTSALVAQLLGEWGYDVFTGIAGTGVVGRLKKGSSAKNLGLRADLDALPIQEATGLPYEYGCPACAGT